MPRKDPRFNPKYAKALQKREDDNKIEGAEIGNGTILAKHIADGSITASKFAPGAISTASLEDGSVTNAKLQDNSVTAAKIATGAVTSEKLSPSIVVPGTITWPNRPAFLVGWNGSVSVSSTPTIIPLNGTVTFNRGNHLNTTTNRFVCPIEGLYMFGFSYLRSPSSIVVRGNLYKNGSTLNQQLRSTAGFNSYNYTAGQWYIAYGNVNDYFDLRISADSATILYNDGGGLTYNWFCGYLVG